MNTENRSAASHNDYSMIIKQNVGNWLRLHQIETTYHPDIIQTWNVLNQTQDTHGYTVKSASDLPTSSPHMQLLLGIEKKMVPPFCQWSIMNSHFAYFGQFSHVCGFWGVLYHLFLDKSWQILSCVFFQTSQACRFLRSFLLPGTNEVLLTDEDGR